jgi:hypothetical protein
MQSINFQRVLGHGFFSAEAVVAVADEQPALRSSKEVQAIESDSITIGSLNVPLTSLTVTPTTLCGEE